MEKVNQSAKKARLEPPRNARVKQEVAVHEATGGSGGDRPVGGGGHQDGHESAPLPTLFPPPEAARLPGMFLSLSLGGSIDSSVSECRKCEHGGGAFDVRNTAMDAVVSAARVECPHGGCGTQVAYHELDAHRGACPHAPCLCTEPGCGFAGLPPAFAAHLAAEHAWPKLKVQYGKVYRIRVPVPSRRLLLGDGDAFVLAAGALDAATAVSVVCVRAGAAPSPRYTCKMWANLPAAAGANGKPDVALVEMNVESSTSPGAVVTTDDLASFLTVPPRYLVPGAAPSTMVVPLSIRIEKVSSSSSSK